MNIRFFDYTSGGGKKQDGIAPLLLFRRPGAIMMKLHPMLKGSRL
jgi:hypothetical protein